MTHDTLNLDEATLKKLLSVIESADTALDKMTPEAVQAFEEALAACKDIRYSEICTEAKAPQV